MPEMTDNPPRFTVAEIPSVILYGYRPGTPNSAGQVRVADLQSAVVSGPNPIGLKQLSIPAGALKIRTTAGAAAGSVETGTNKHMIDSLDFDAATQEHAQFALVLPQGWDAGTLAFAFVWTTTGTTGNVIWGAQGVCRADGDALDVAFGTAVEVADACLGADKSHRTATTAAMTLAGTPAKGERVALQFYRKAADAGDTLAADAKLLEVIVFFTTDAATDATV